MDGVKAKLSALWAKSKAVGMSVAVAMSLTLPAFASGDGGGSGSSGGLTAVTAAADTVVTFTGKAFDLITGNPLTAVYLASGLIGVGLGKFISMRRASR